MAKQRRKSTHCPNCGYHLQTFYEFCPACGQENHTLKAPLKHVLYEFVESITHFDHKLFTTLKSLFTKPGEYTLDFVNDKRARYVPPARLYIFVTFIFFLLLGISLNSNEDHHQSNSKRQVSNSNLNFQIGGLSIKEDSSIIVKDKVKEHTDSLFRTIDKSNYLEELEKHYPSSPNTENWIDNKIAVQKYKFFLDPIGARHTFYKKIITSISIAMFLLMPFSAWLLLLIFYRKSFFYEHLIFSINIHTVFFIIGIFRISSNLLTQNSLIIDIFNLILTLSSIVYLILSLKRVYKKNFRTTLFRLLIMAIPYSIAFIIIFALALIYAFSTF